MNEENGIVRDTRNGKLITTMKLLRGWFFTNSVLSVKIGLNQKIPLY